MHEHLKGDESLSVCLHLVPRPTTCLCTVVQKRYKYSLSITCLIISWGLFNVYGDFPKQFVTWELVLSQLFPNNPILYWYNNVAYGVAYINLYTVRIDTVDLLVLTL